MRLHHSSELFFQMQGCNCGPKLVTPYSLAILNAMMISRHLATMALVLFMITSRYLGIFTEGADLNCAIVSSGDQR